MVSLVEDMMDAVPNVRVTNTVGILYLHAFALNRRNLPGDRDKALPIIHKVSAVFNDDHFVPFAHFRCCDVNVGGHVSPEIWVDGHMLRGWVWSYGGTGVLPHKIFANICSDLCNLVHFWRPVQQKCTTGCLI